MRSVPVPGRLEEEVGSSSERDGLMEREGGHKMKEERSVWTREAEGLSRRLSTRHVVSGRIDSPLFHTIDDKM